MFILWFNIQRKIEMTAHIQIGIPSCSKQDCENLATHFCKTCEQNLCKFDIIKHYKNKLFNKDHEMIPI